MYKVFINNKPVVFTEENYLTSDFQVGEVVLQYRTKSDFDKLFDLAYSLNDRKRIYFVTHNLAQTWNDFVNLFKEIHAGGGIVTNSASRLLMIFRKGFWDLPKGKIEKGETVEAGALREVCEETGICNLSIQELAEETWHTYVQNKKHFLKRTSWFKMSANGNEPLSIQRSEGITEAKWVDSAQIRELKAFIYPSIYMLVKTYFIKSSSPD